MNQQFSELEIPQKCVVKTNTMLSRYKFSGKKTSGAQHDCEELNDCKNNFQNLKYI